MRRSITVLIAHLETYFYLPPMAPYEFPSGLFPCLHYDSDAWQGLCWYMSSRLRCAVQFYIDHHSAMSLVRRSVYKRVLSNEVVSHQRGLLSTC